MMRRYFCSVGLLLAASSVYVGLAHAYPTYSPSAREAARLKNNPPRGWLTHYLGDDRYKIAGKVWKLVSTPNDSQSYPAWAPEMLSRPASNVIGFASVEDAVEAGYPPSGRYGSMFPDHVKEGSASPSGGVTTVNRGGKSIRITLADGRSTVELPPNWRRTQSGASTLVGRASKSDVLQPLNGKGYIRISFIPYPREILMSKTESERHFTPETFRGYLKAAGNADAFLKLFNLGSANVGGIRGVLLSAKPGGALDMSSRGIPSGRIAIANLGSNLFTIEDSSQGALGTNKIFSSFRPR